jgi:hypothetical protein
MARVTTLPKSVTESTPVLAAVGVTELAVERVRAAAAGAQVLQGQLETRFAKAQADAEARLTKAASRVESGLAQVRESVEGLDAKTLSAQAQQVPALAVARALELAGRVEQSYASLAGRGRELLDRLTSQKATQELISQGKVTLSRSRAAVTTARKAVDQTTAAARSAVGVGAREAVEAVKEIEKDVEKVVQGRAATTKKAATSASTTARTRAVRTRTAVKSASTSAKRTTTAAKKAVKSGAAKIGD